MIYFMYSLMQPDQGFEPYLPAGSIFIRWWENRGPEIGSTGTALCNNIVTHTLAGTDKHLIDIGEILQICVIY